MENREGLSPKLTREEIIKKAAKINEEIDNATIKGMSLEEINELKKQREQLLSLLPEYQEPCNQRGEKKEAEEVAGFDKEVLSKETEMLKNEPSGIKKEELSDEELGEFEEILEKVDAELEFLKISTYTREEKIESINQQLAILGEILPKFNKAKVNELLLFRKASGLNERLLHLKEESWLLGS